MKIGIALSGGGMRGIAHAGVLKALEENDIKIDIIGGTSSGSLVASLYAMGYSPYYIYLLFQRYAKDMVSMDLSPIFNGVGELFKNKKFQIVGINNGKNIEKEYNNLALRKGVKTISDISMPIIIPSVDINTAKEYIFTNCDIKNRIINKNQKENKEESYLEILNLAKRVLNLKDPSKEIYSKLIKKIEFNSNKEVTVTLTFGEVKIEEYKKAI